VKTAPPPYQRQGRFFHGFEMTVFAIGKYSNQFHNAARKLF
jgi:hypothetical protein